MFGKLNDLAGKLGVDLNHIKLDEVLTDAFIKNNTTLNTVKEFIEKSGFDVSSIVDFDKLPLDKLDSFVRSISQFGSWKELLAKAAGSKLGGFLNS